MAVRGMSRQPTSVMKAIPAYNGLPVGNELLTFASAAISLGMVLGFASLLPGGAGVREWVTLIVLGTVTDPTHALLCVITARMLFIVVESILALVSHLYLRCPFLDGPVLSYFQCRFHSLS